MLGLAQISSSPRLGTIIARPKHSRRAPEMVHDFTGQPNSRVNLSLDRPNFTMSKKTAVSDAWDDDWDADNSDDGGVQLNQHAPEESKLTKAQILARHEEENRKVWQSAYVFIWLSRSIRLGG